MATIPISTKITEAEVKESFRNLTVKLLEARKAGPERSVLMKEYWEMRAAHDKLRTEWQNQ